MVQQLPAQISLNLDVAVLYKRLCPICQADLVRLLVRETPYEALAPLVAAALAGAPAAEKATDGPGD